LKRLRQRPAAPFILRCGRRATMIYS
jgi:hypothetical protein